MMLFVAPVDAQQARETVRANADRVTELYRANQENLAYDEVLQLATEVVQYRQQYPKEIIAQAYVLLAEVASNKGDYVRAFQFAVDGLTYKPLPPELQLNLEMRLTSGYFVKGQYHNVFHFVEQALELSQQTGLVKYQLLSLGYRAMANALIGEAKKAADDLLAIKALMNENRQYAEYIDLLEIIAISYHYLGDYQTAVEMHERILKLRFALNMMLSLERTYYNLASAYHKVGRLDDAYNAFWEVKQIAEREEWPIKRAYAELGLGQVLLAQGEFENAYKILVEAENSFKGQNLNSPYLGTLVELTKASLATGRDEFAEQILSLAEQLAEVAEVTPEQVDLFLLLSQRYERQGDIAKALAMLNKYVSQQQQFSQSNNGRRIELPTILKQEANNKDIALDLAQSYEMHTEYASKVDKQNQTILLLTIVSLILLGVAVTQWYGYRSRQQNFVYEQLERPAYLLASPAQTKYIYHRAFKKARKYEYPLTVGYIVVSNWQDLTFSFNKRVINEVNKTIATLVNEHLGEFDQAGQIHEGEYIVLYPHQHRDEAKAKFEKLLEALKVRFFANLGEFSVNIRFSMETPSIQDIDPYIFLSRLSDVS